MACSPLLRPTAASHLLPAFCLAGRFRASHASPRSFARRFSSAPDGPQNADAVPPFRVDMPPLPPSTTQSTLPSPSFDNMTPRQMMSILERHIVGQQIALPIIVNSLRSRWRRQQLHCAEMRECVVPRNILMIGPTGVGKTEIARRLAAMMDAPFIKVEATSFTEVGFHGRDVDTIISDLVESSVKRYRHKLEAAMTPEVANKVDRRLLHALIDTSGSGRDEKWLPSLRAGDFDDQDIPMSALSISQALAFQEAGALSGDFESLDGGPMAGYSQSTSRGRASRAYPSSGSRGGKTGSALFSDKVIKLRDARRLMLQDELNRRIPDSLVVERALEAVQQNGIVFIDEIDKLCNSSDSYYKGPDASAEGVQRDLLPLLEGCSVKTRHGSVKTDHILFIAAGAFHTSKPDDLLAELQGRLPVRISLQPLNQADLERVLREPPNNLVRQNIALMKTEGIDLHFTDDAISEIAALAASANEHVENLGARRLHTILESIMCDLSFRAPEMPPGTQVTIGPEHVNAAVGTSAKRSDLRRYML